MPRVPIVTLLGVTIVLGASGPACAQLPRSRSAGPDAPAAASGVRPDAAFPYAGLWRGARTMPVGTDSIGLRFTVANGKYRAAIIHAPGGRGTPETDVTSSAAGLTWEQPNSGGGTWVYRVRLAGPDSMVGTLVLRDAPPALTPAPRGTMVFTRAPDAGVSRR